MQQNFAAALALTLKHEGGKVDDPHDPGGRTNRGITQSTFNAWLSSHGSAHRDVFTITPDEVKAIYRANYWNAIRGDDLPAGVDFVTFDFAVNSGVARAAITLQEALSVAPDGRIGPLTIAAASKGDRNHLITKVSAMRMAFLRKLSTWQRFGKGWAARVDDVEAKALALTRAHAASH